MHDKSRQDQIQLTPARSEGSRWNDKRPSKGGSVVKMEIGEGMGRGAGEG